MSLYATGVSTTMPKNCTCRKNNGHINNLVQELDNSRRAATAGPPQFSSRHKPRRAQQRAHRHTCRQSSETQREVRKYQQNQEQHATARVDNERGTSACKRQEQSARCMKTSTTSKMHSTAIVDDEHDHFCRQLRNIARSAPKPA